MIKLFANIISFVFHPLFVLIYILGLLLIVNPYIFRISDEKERAIFFIYTFVSLIVIPGVSIIILKQLDFIKSFKMEEKLERVGPLIIVGVVYLWLYINYKNAASVPLIFTSFMLGSVISVFTSFFINNFTKISLHTVGMGGLVAAIWIMKYNLNYDDFYINISVLGQYKVNIYAVLLLAILLGGLIGTVRLYLNRHSREQVYSGYVVGFLAQMIAYSLVF